MASSSLILRGTIDVGLDALGCATTVNACGGKDRYTVSLALKDCSGAFFQSIVLTPVALSVNTTGLPGVTFEDIDILNDLAEIEFLRMHSNTNMVMRIDGAAAALLGTGGVFPSGFVGGETMNITVDGNAFVVNFQAADQTALQVAARINAEAAFNGLATPLATVDTGGQLLLTGRKTGASASVLVTGGTGAAAIGFAGVPTAFGSGADVPFCGEFLIEFGKGTNAPSKIEISGQGELSVLAAGRTA